MLLRTGLLALSTSLSPHHGKLWTPQAPAIIRPGSEQKPQLAMLPGFCVPMGMAGGIGDTPTFVAAGTVATGTTSVAVPYYAGLAANDIAFMVVVSASTPTIATPTDWTQAAAQQVHDTTNATKFLWMRLVGSESGTVTVNCTGGATSSGVMFGIRGCVTSGTPFEGYDSRSNGAGGDTVLDVDNLITTGINRLGVYVGGMVPYAATTPFSGWTEMFDGGNGANSGVFGDYKAIPTASTTNDEDIERTTALTSSGCTVLAFKPTGS